MKGKMFRGCSADETAKIGICEVTETYFESQTKVGLYFSGFVAIDRFEQRSDSSFRGMD